MELEASVVHSGFKLVATMQAGSKMPFLITNNIKHVF